MLMEAHGRRCHPRSRLSISAAGGPGARRERGARAPAVRHREPSTRPGPSVLLLRPLSAPAAAPLGGREGVGTTRDAHSRAPGSGAVIIS